MRAAEILAQIRISIKKVGMGMIKSATIMMTVSAKKTSGWLAMRENKALGRHALRDWATDFPRENEEAMFKREGVEVYAVWG